MAKKELFNIVIVGAGSAGKTAITHKFMFNNFLDTYEPTTADQYRKNTVIDGIPCQLDLLDTAGQEMQMRDTYYKGADGFLVVYSITMQATMAAARAFHQEILNSRGPVPTVITGNKCDLERIREISKEEGLAWAGANKCPFLESSAKTGLNVDAIFAELVREIRKARALTNPPNRQFSCCVLM